MIGTKMKGFRHLIRMAKTLNEVSFLFKYNHFQIGYGVMLYVSSDVCKNPFRTSNSDYVLIFNNYNANVRFDKKYYNGCAIEAKIKELSEKLGNVWVLPVDKRNFLEDSSIFTHKVFVPEDFEKRYKDFCEANKKQMPNATRFVDIDSSILKYFFALSNGSKNFFFWAVNAYFKNSLSIYLIEKFLLWNDKYSQLSKNLKKGTITGYTSQADFLCLLNEMAKLRRDKRANDVINMFNTVQKKALKSVALTDRDYDTLSKFGKLSGKKKNNFIRKMSTIDNPNEIIKQMSFLADIHFEWNKNSFIEYLKNTDNLKCEIVIDKGDMVLLKVDDYETVKRLAKTTNWCISKDKKYWNDYVENKQDATQYVIMDFSKKEDDNLSIIGFTSVHDRGITNAHDFQNKNLMRERVISPACEIKSFIRRNIENGSIFNVLDRHGIKLSDVVTYEPSQYHWDRDSMFGYLNQCIDEDDYYIIYDDGKRLVIIAENDNIRYFFGDVYAERVGGRTAPGQEYIIFADFSKNENDSERLVFGVIHHNFEEHESSCSRLYNSRFEPIVQSFDSKIEEFGLPYDVICRKNNVVERFYDALSQMELATVKDMIKDDKVRQSLNNKERLNTVTESINNVTFNLYSDDYLNLFYSNNFTLTDIMGARNASDVAKRLVSCMYDAIRYSTTGCEKNIPNEKELDEFFHNAIEDNGKALYIGDFLMLIKFIDKENDADTFSRLLMFIRETHCVCDLFDLVLSKICDKLDTNKLDHYNIFKLIASYAYPNNREVVINSINRAQEKNHELKNYLGKAAPKANENFVTMEQLGRVPHIAVRRR